MSKLLNDAVGELAKLPSVGKRTALRLALHLLGEEPDPTLVEKLSIENSVTPLFPPTFLWNTYTDGVVPAENSLLLAASLRKAGVSVEFHMYHQGPHGLSMCDHTTATNENSVNPHCASWFPLCCEWLTGIWS